MQLRRSAILSEIERKLKIAFKDILVEVSPENDALRFKGDGLFNQDQQLSPSKRLLRRLEFLLQMQLSALR